MKITPENKIEYIFNKLNCAIHKFKNTPQRGKRLYFMNHKSDYGISYNRKGDVYIYTWQGAEYRFILHCILEGRITTTGDPSHDLARLLSLTRDDIESLFKGFLGRTASRLSIEPYEKLGYRLYREHIGTFH